MEYKKGSTGFSLEFNDKEERHFERFVNELKQHDEFNSLTSKNEFLALIINEGVASLQQKTSIMLDNHKSGNLFDFSELLTTVFNERLATILQYKNDTVTIENGFPFSHDLLLSLIPDINWLNNEKEYPMEKKHYLASLDKPLTPSPNNGKDRSAENSD
ncbi:hypothetical protein [Bacillus xiapuensis]|uniref:Uncharacterized protein n=1 Tax=Bacillus xiapuensis TaxID=2014075 RepID=A0ABU6NF87_9BACI|nr:hypothetical protein [Bacillus xiapuensis]